jgi:predicted permease
LNSAAAIDRQTQRLSVIGRRAAGVSSGQAEAFLATLGSRLAADRPTETGEFTLRSEGLPVAGMSPTGRAILWMLLGLSGFVLLIACSNLANFLLARTIERSREVAVRAALGAARSQLLKPFVCEALTLAILGGAGALLVSRWTTGWLHSIIWNHGGPTIDFTLDSRVLVFNLAVAVVTILLFGVGPALVTLRIQAAEALKSGARGGTPGRGQQRLTRWLIGGQFTLAMILLAGAGYFVRGASNLLDKDHGWSSKQVVQSEIGLPPDAYPDNQRLATFHEQLIDRVKRMPGVEAASLSRDLPFLGLRSWTRYTAEDQATSEGRELQVFLNDITPDYFAVTGTRLLAGRGFNETDSATSPRVVIINETMARKFFPKRDPIGGRVSPTGAEVPEWAEVVGVVADALSADVADQPLTCQLYKPMTQSPARSFKLAVRAGGVPLTSVMSSMRSAVAELDPHLEIRELMTADRKIAQLTSQLQMVRHLLTAFAGLGLFLATIGIYGMIARTVVQRTGEIGIRMALGAQVRDVVRLILGFGFRVALVGALVGAVGAFGLSRLLAAVLPAMQTNPTLVILSAMLLLLAMAAVASWQPTRRAAAVQPMEALRQE